MKSTIEFEEVRLVIDHDYSAGSPMTYDSPGDYPSADISDVLHKGESVIGLLSEEQLDEIEEIIIDQIGE